MKYLVFLLAFGMLVATSCNDGNTNGGIDTGDIHNPETASGDVDPENMPVIKFEKELYEFGTITQGEKVEHLFKFTNTGKSDLFITRCSATCGCTVPEWPKEPLAPGESGEIKVIFDSNGKRGKQHKKVTIVANTQPSTSVVALSGQVTAPDIEEVPEVETETAE